jgi:hypothetical protein
LRRRQQRQSQDEDGEPDAARAGGPALAPLLNVDHVSPLLDLTADQ